jgi:hypothetical protein
LTRCPSASRGRPAAVGALAATTSPTGAKRTGHPPSDRHGPAGRAPGRSSHETPTRMLQAQPVRVSLAGSAADADDAPPHKRAPGRPRDDGPSACTPDVVSHAPRPQLGNGHDHRCGRPPVRPSTPDGRPPEPPAQAAARRDPQRDPLTLLQRQTNSRHQHPPARGPSSSVQQAQCCNDRLRAGGVEAAGRQLGELATPLERSAPKTACVLADADDDVTVYATFPRYRWRTIGPTNPPERANKAIKWRTAVYGADLEGQHEKRQTAVRCCFPLTRTNGLNLEQSITLNHDTKIDYRRRPDKNAPHATTLLRGTSPSVSDP